MSEEADRETPEGIDRAGVEGWFEAKVEGVEPPLAFEMIAGGRLDPSRLVTKRIPLEEAGAALTAMDGYTAAGITVIDRFR